MPVPSHWWRQNLWGSCAQQRLETGLPSESPSVLPYNNDMDRFLTVQRASRCCHCPGFSQIPHCDCWSSAPWWYADDIALTSNTAESLQLQMNKFHDCTRFKGLKLNTDKTKVMVFISRTASAITTFTYYGTPLELVTEFKYLVITLTRDGSMLTAAEKMAGNLRSAIARAYRTGDSKVWNIENMPYYGFSRSLLWQLVPEPVRLSSMGHFFSDIWFLKTTPTHVLHLGLLNRLLGVRKGTNTHCVLRKQVRCPFFFFFFFFWVGVVTRSSARAWQNEGKTYKTGKRKTPA